MAADSEIVETKSALLTNMPHNILEKYVKNIEISLNSKQQGYRFFSESYFESMKTYRRNYESTIMVKAKCHLSQRKKKIPHLVNLDTSSGSVDMAHCSSIALFACGRLRKL